MFDTRAFATRKLSALAPKYLPFADVATQDVPLSRLLRLSLFQISVGMALVLIAGTLNRVMIVELSVPASLVAIMLALPLLFAPFRTLIGFKSDVHVSALGLRRVPYIWKGTLYQFGGFAIMPFALLVLSGYGESYDAPLWLGYGSAGLAFLLVGAGVHIVQTVGLALATDLVEEEDQPKVVGLMYVMLLLGMILSALVFGALLEEYSPGRLIQVIQGAAVTTAGLNLVAMWRQEARDRNRARAMKEARPMQFSQAWQSLVQRPGMMRLLVIIGLGTFGYGMADVLLEPYGGQVLGLSVASTTKLTALFGLGTFIGFGLASKVLGQGASPLRYSIIGAAIGVPGFLAIILSSATTGVALFLVGTFTIGLGTGLFGHATLTATIRSAPRNQIGLALGAWGAVQATAAGVGVALAGITRDLIVGLERYAGNAPQTPYNFVFSLEILFLALALLVTWPFLKDRSRNFGLSDTDTDRRDASEPHANPMEVS